MTTRQRFERLTMTLAALAALSSCAPDDETDTESASQAATASPVYKTVTLRRWPNGVVTQRFQKITCGTKCLASHKEPTGYYHPKTGEPLYRYVCDRYGADCDVNVDKVELFPTMARAQEGSTPYRAQDAYGGAVSVYMGCGPQAAMNFAHYVGLDRFRIEDAHRLTGTWTIRTITPDWVLERLPESWTGIGSTPDQLRRGLSASVDDAWNTYRPTVRNRQPLRSVRDHLMKGMPVVLLVYGGWHYQVVTGYKRGVNGEDEYHVIDYVDRGLNGWVKARDLRFDNLEGMPNALFGYDGYEPGTMVTFDPIIDWR